MAKSNAQGRRPRLDWIDVAKGYGIIMVIIGHLHFPRIIPYIYTFHLPLFFFLSGYVFRTYASWSIFWRKKVRSLLVPYFGYGLVNIAFYFLYTVGVENFTWEALGGKLLDLLIQRRFWVFWFLTALFLVEMIFYVLARLLPRERTRLAAVLLLTGVGIAYLQGGGQPLPWNLDAALMALPFFYFGHVYYRLHLPVCRRRQLRAWLIMAVAILLDLSCFLLNRHLGHQYLEMFRSRYTLVPLTYLGAFAGITAAVIFSQLFTPRAIKYLGRHSLFLFTCHQKIFLPLITDFLLAYGAFLGEKHSPTFQVTLLTLILVSMAVCCLVADAYRRARGRRFKQSPA